MKENQLDLDLNGGDAKDKDYVPPNELPVEPMNKNRGMQEIEKILQDSGMSGGNTAARIQEILEDLRVGKIKPADAVMKAEIIAKEAPATTND